MASIVLLGKGKVNILKMLLTRVRGCHLNPQKEEAKKEGIGEDKEQG